jgi:hypothetical protein
MARIGYVNYSLLPVFMRELMPINRSHEANLPMSEKTHPKHSFSKKLGEGEFLSVAVWAGRSNPEDEVLSVQLRKFDGSWRTLGRLALYRTKEGTYSELPERATTQAEGAR